MPGIQILTFTVSLSNASTVIKTLLLLELLSKETYQDLTPIDWHAEDSVCSTMRLSSFLAVFRPALPLILGLSLGCSLSLLMVSWTQGETDEACGDELGNGRLIHSGHIRDHQDSQDGNEDFQPRIVPYHKDPNKPHKKVLR